MKDEASVGDAEGLEEPHGVAQRTSTWVQLITAQNVADLLSVHRATVWRWAKDGMIPKPIRIGGRTRWRLEEIEALVKDLSEAA